MEKEYIRKAIEGDNQAFEKLVVLYQRRLFSFVKLKKVNSSDIQEIVQETFFQCFINLKKLRNVDSFNFWLLKICLVKSRLYEAKVILKTLIPNLYHGIEIPHEILKINKEQIMKKIDLIEKGAYVIRALSLDDQIHLCELIIKGEKFDDRLLIAFSKIKYGKEFVKGYESRLMISYFSRIITYAPDLDFWLIGNLDKLNPELSEIFKRNTFVFEDIVLLDPKDVTTLVKKIDPEAVFTAAMESNLKKQNVK